MRAGVNRWSFGVSRSSAVELLSTTEGTELHRGFSVQLSALCGFQFLPRDLGLEILGLEIGAYVGGAEGDLEGGLDVYGRAIFHSGLELPSRDGLAGVVVEAVVDPTQYAHVAHGAVGADDRVEDHGAGDVLAHELRRIGRIDFAGGGGLGEI